MQGIKVTCSTKKVVLLRQPEIEDQPKAAQAAANRVGETADKYSFSLTMNQEMLKLLLVSVDGKKIKASQREHLGDLLSYVEFQEVMGVVGKLTVTDTTPGTEFVNLSQEEPSKDS